MQPCQYSVSQHKHVFCIQCYSIQDVSLDVAVEEAGPNTDLAVGVEQCQCPSEYEGTSCQNPAPGYFRYVEHLFTADCEELYKCRGLLWLLDFNN